MDYEQFRNKYVESAYADRFEPDIRGHVEGHYQFQISPRLVDELEAKIRRYQGPVALLTRE